MYIVSFKEIKLAKFESLQIMESDVSQNDDHISNKVELNVMEFYECMEHGIKNTSNISESNGCRKF